MASAEDLVEQAERSHHLVLRDEEALGGQHLDQEQREHERLAAAEAEPADRERPEEGDGERRYDGRRVRRARRSGPAEAGSSSDGAQVVEGARRRHERRGRATAA